MIEKIPEFVNANEKLVRRGRYVNTTFLVEVGESTYMVTVRQGQVASVARGPFVTPNYSFAFRASRDTWDMFWQAIPPPGWNDLFALVKRGAMTIEGDLHPFMANLFYFKDVLASPRQLSVAGSGGVREPAL